MYRTILFSEEAQQKLLAGLDKLANAVKATLGPKGRNVVIGNNGAPPSITKDGVTVASRIFLEDEIENLGAQMLKEAAGKTAELAGDGTTTATVLAQFIVHRGMEMAKSGFNPIDIKRGIDKAVTVVIDQLKKMSTSIGEDLKEVAHIADVSSNFDVEIGGTVAKVMEAVGRDGVVYVEDAKGSDTSFDIIKGMQIDSGYITTKLINVPEKRTTELDKPIILLYENKVLFFQDLVKILEKIIDPKGPMVGRPLLIIAEDVAGEALATLVANVVKGNFMATAVRAPGWGELRKELMSDVAAFTGATVLGDEIGIQLKGAGLDHLGTCDKVIISNRTTTFIGGGNAHALMDAKIMQLKGQIEASKTMGEQKLLQERLGKLTSGIAMINVGAASELEAKEKKDRFDDALHATRAALQEGFVPGGGVSYMRCRHALRDMVGSNDAENAGIAIVRDALLEPMRQIVTNSGIDPMEVIRKIEDDATEAMPSYGYNARTEQYEDLVAAGVIDPTKVARVALENASSVAGMILTTECVMSDLKDLPAQQQQGYYR